MTARLAYLGVPHLSLLLTWRAHPELRTEPVLVAGNSGGGRTVVLAVSPAAAAAGVKPGQDWRRAQIACPKAVQLEADPAALAQLRRRALLALTECSPLVEWDRDVGAYLDLGGHDPRHRQEAARAASCGRTLQRELGVPPQVGVGPSRFSAWVAARGAAPGRMRLVPAGGAAQLLATWPVTGLPIPPLTQERLLQFGLRTCGDCLTVPLPDLQRQLGPDGLLLHRLCQGTDSTLLHPWREPLPCTARGGLAGAVDDLESLRFGAPQLAAELAGHLRSRGQAAGRIRLLLLGAEVERNASVDLGRKREVWWRELAPPQPLATQEELLGAALNLLGQVHLDFPVAAVELQALELVAALAHQGGLWRSPASDAAVAAAAGRLRDRFGAGLVWRVSLRPGHPGDAPEERLIWEAV